MAEKEQETRLTAALDEIQRLKGRLAALEASVVRGRDLPRTSLLSHSFLGRAFSCWGLNLVAYLFVAIPLYLLALLLPLLYRLFH